MIENIKKVTLTVSSKGFLASPTQVQLIYKEVGQKFDNGRRFSGRTTKIGTIFPHGTRNFMGNPVKSDPSNLGQVLNELSRQGFDIEQNVWQAVQAALT